ncbi:MAG: pyridoxal phosphate-dependent aminotransferase, partial [Planctomycetes bacterium]|nr:pyridoxal phosphate-dependent aminotransferase [Planctomycetota bacterium]
MSPHARSLRPNQLVESLEESVTLAIAALARNMRQQGVDVISLSAGEPDFGTVEAVGEAGIRAIRGGETRYTAAAGTPELRRAAAAWFQREFGLQFGSDQVMATAGIKPALHMALSTLVEPGDTVLLPAPYWASYPSLVQIARGVPVDVPAGPEQGFLPTGADIRAAARTHRARGIMLNFPNNPSGAVPDRAQLEEIVAAAAEEDLWILSDEIYSSILYDGAEHISPANLDPERTLVVNGGSKSHSLTGWRIGFLAGPADVIAAAARLQSQAIGNPCSISQAAGLEACAGDHSAEIARRVAAFDSRRRFLVDALNEIDGLAATLPRGAFYVLADARPLCARYGVDDVGLAKLMLERARVAVVPGTP